MSTQGSSPQSSDAFAAFEALAQVHSQNSPASKDGRFFPKAVTQLKETGLSETMIDSMLQKALFSMGVATSKTLAEQTKLPGVVVRDVLERLRSELIVTHKGTADLVDFVYELTEKGNARARMANQSSTYFGAAPVRLDEYIASVSVQSICRTPVRLDLFRKALSDLYLSKVSLNALAQATNAAQGIFLYGEPGNGKTSVANRVTRSYPNFLWIPRTIVVGSDIIRLFDASVHAELDPVAHGYAQNHDEYDRRWVLIHRPTIVVGGELLLEHLEITEQPGTGVLEGPVQLKSNGGSLVIDDFGRQRVSPTELLNRWIVPLDRRLDFLTLPNGRQIQVPFDQNLIFATNLEPEELVDEALLRRIPFKIRLGDPDESSFRQVFHTVAKSMKFECDDEMLTYLIDKHYKNHDRPFRFCQPRDLLFQIDNLCRLLELPRKVTTQTIDVAVSNYFRE